MRWHAVVLLLLSANFHSNNHSIFCGCWLHISSTYCCRKQFPAIRYNTLPPVCCCAFDGGFFRLSFFVLSFPDRFLPSAPDPVYPSTFRPRPPFAFTLPPPPPRPSASVSTSFYLSLSRRLSLLFLRSLSLFTFFYFQPSPSP